LAVGRLRRDRGWSQATLGIHSELSAESIGNVERGVQELTWGNLRHLAEGLGVSLGDLNRLAVELAPGPAGDRLRESEQEAVHFHVEAEIGRAMEGKGQQA
jgi:transcriptional regulator with XRE-family HTH domain